jgi:predicted XRE-type DNA-binding protein
MTDEHDDEAGEADCWRKREMPKRENKRALVTRGNVFEDLGFTAEEAAILGLKTQLHIEIMRAIRQQKFSPRQLEKVLGVPQPRVSELLNGKISRMTADLLAKYLYRLGREVTMKTKTSRSRAAAMA